MVAHPLGEQDGLLDPGPLPVPVGLNARGHLGQLSVLLVGEILVQGGRPLFLCHRWLTQKAGWGRVEVWLSQRSPHSQCRTGGSPGSCPSLLSPVPADELLDRLNRQLHRQGDIFRLLLVQAGFLPLLVPNHVKRRAAADPQGRGGGEESR